MRYISLFLLCFALVATTAAQARPIKTMVETINKPITIEAKNSKLLDVVFNHTSHRGINCFTCHHVASESKGRYISCTECHENQGRSTKSLSLFRAAHAKDSRHSCYACHANQAMESEKYATIFYNCRPCHMGSKQTPTQGTPNAQAFTNTAEK